MDKNNVIHQLSNYSVAFWGKSIESRNFPDDRRDDVVKSILGFWVADKKIILGF